MEQGDVVPQLTLTYDGFKNGETAKVLKKQPMATTNATSESPAGSYQILVSGGEADNYDITRVNGTLTITVPVGIYAARDQLLKGRDVYDLTGRKLNRITRRGVYVVNGKRITVK